MHIVAADSVPFGSVGSPKSALSALPLIHFQTSLSFEVSNLSIDLLAVPQPSNGEVPQEDPKN